MNEGRYNNELIVLRRVEVELNNVKILLENPQGHEDSHARSLCAYSIQQACEKMLKIQIYNSLGSKSDIKSHDLDYLLFKYKNDIHIVPEDIVKNASKITDWEASSRYDMQYDVSEGVLKFFLSVCENWFLELLEEGYKYV